MHVRRALALAVVGPLLFAGCTGDPEPTPNIPDPTSSSPTALPTDSERSEAETPEAETAEEFIRRWVEVSNEMQNTGEAAEYLEMSSRCGACRRVAERVEGAFNAGGFVRTNGWRILKIEDRSEGGTRQVLDVRVDSAPTTVQEDASAAKQRLPGGEVVFRFRLNAEQPWSLTQLTQVPS